MEYTGNSNKGGNNSSEQINKEQIRSFTGRDIRDRRKAAVCIGIALVTALLLTGWLLRERGLIVEARASKAQEKLAGEVLRFHVLANSDSEEDQALKMEVKEAVLDYMKKDMPNGGSAKETKEWASLHLGEIEEISQSVIVKEKFDYNVTAELTTDDFPEKTYGDITFPAGKYEALRINIGEAKGHNWWCCLYPNLCFTDAVHAVVPKEGKEELKQVLDDSEYEMVTATSNFKIKWFFFSDGEEEN